MTRGQMKSLASHRCVLGAVAALVTFAVGSTSVSADTTYLRIGGGIGGSSWELTAGKAADMFSNAEGDIRAIAQPGNLGENIARLRRGETDIGVVFSFVSEGMATGEGNFSDFHAPGMHACWRRCIPPTSSH